MKKHINKIFDMSININQLEEKFLLLYPSYD